ncbi:MAG: hypothetical protein ACRD0G_01050, partial [Acidimicrobiales bacterium]
MPPNVEMVARALQAVPGVTRVRLVGSRAAGVSTPLSDWDFEIDVDDERVLASLEERLRQIPALATFWDPLSSRANLILLLDGPVKIDVIAADQPNPAPIDRWEVSAGTLPGIDAHFWDWILWLGAKHLRGDGELVRDELDKMHAALLEPLGATEPAGTVAEAVAAYLQRRDARAAEF